MSNDLHVHSTRPTSVFVIPTELFAIQNGTVDNLLIRLLINNCM